MKLPKTLIEYIRDELYEKFHKNSDFFIPISNKNRYLINRAKF